MFIERIEELLRQKGIRKKEFFASLNLSPNSFHNWQKRGTIPSGEILQKIADYFGVTVDYLLGNDQPSAPSAPVSDEDIKFALFGGEGEITDEMYAEVKRYAEFVLHKYGKK